MAPPVMKLPEPALRSLVTRGQSLDRACQPARHKHECVTKPAAGMFQSVPHTGRVARQLVLES